ncbi:MAG: hypothetical protein LBL62_01580 [Planctomycetaceae bacterium]|nr:hypothetical protein [Planctomycetaceae bacterium]
MLPLQGDCSGGTYPPRCGGLAYLALAGRRKKFAILLRIALHNETKCVYL